MCALLWPPAPRGSGQQLLCSVGLRLCLAVGVPPPTVPVLRGPRSVCRAPQEAARMQRDLLDFPSKLPHVGPASR